MTSFLLLDLRLICNSHWKILFKKNGHSIDYHLSPTTYQVGSFDWYSAAQLGLYISISIVVKAISFLIGPAENLTLTENP